MAEYLHPEGNRIAKGAISSFSCDTTQNGFTPTALYILGPGGQQLTEMTWSGGTAQWAHTNVWAAGAGLIATYSPDSSGQTAGILNFELNDWLGTRRVLTDYTGNVEETCDSLPYGNGETCAPTPTEHLYTQHERDAETNNDYFGARYYASSMGRFISPDDGSDQDAEDLQSWNLYAYVRDNPLINVDPDGHGCDTVTYTTISNGKKTTETWATPDAWCPGSALFGLLWDSFSNPINSAVHTASQAIQQTSHYLATTNWGCVGKRTGGGAAVGVTVGSLTGLAGLAGGPAVVITEPSAIISEGAWGMGSGFMGGLGTCGGNFMMSGSGGGGSKFGSNQRQNKMANDAKRDAERTTGKKFTPALDRKFHDEITGQEIGDYHELVQIAEDILEGRI